MTDIPEHRATTFDEVYAQLTTAERGRLEYGLGGVSLGQIARNPRDTAGWILKTVGDRLGRDIESLFPTRYRARKRPTVALDRTRTTAASGRS